MLFTSSSFISCYQVTGNQINIAQCLAAKFFNVYPGRYRCMPVAVKRVRTMEQWTKDVFWVFLHEVETIRSATAMSVSQSVCLSVCLSLFVGLVQEQAKMSLKVCLPLVCSLPVCHQSSLCLSSVLHLNSLSSSLSTHTSQLQCPCVVQFLGATIDCQHKACAILTEYMARRSLDIVLHVKKTPLDWNTRLRIVGVVT